MPLPMVHLGVAHFLLNEEDVGLLKGVDPAQFCLGAIAPDAVHMREGYMREFKNASHLRSEGYSRSEDRENVMVFLSEYAKADDRSFHLGYAVHALTDIEWVEGYYRVFLERYNSDENPAQEGIPTYYSETNQIDFVLYRECEWSKEVIGLLERAKSAGVEGLVSAEEVDGWRTKTVRLFGGECKYKLPVKYMKKDELVEFIGETYKKIASILRGY